MADTASFSAAMKTQFLGPIRDNLAKGKVLLFGDSDANPTDFKGIIGTAEGLQFVGNDFRIPLKASRNASVGFRSENATLPAPGKSGYTYLTEPLRYAYSLFNITGQLMKASASNSGAFAAAFKAEMEDTILSSKLDYNRAAYGDGSGALCAVTGTNALNATTVTIDSTINFRGGEIIDFVNAAGVVISPAHTVGAVDRVGLSIGIAPGLAAALTAGTHFPVRASSDSTIAVPNNSQNQEIQGLKSIVSNTGTLHGVNPTTYPFWKSYQKAIGGAISDTVLRDAKDGTMFESGADLESSGLDFALVTTRGIRRRYSDTLLANRQVQATNPVELHGGFKVLYFDENPIFVDDQCPVGNVWGLSLKSLFWASMSDWDWMDEDGKVLKWDTARKDRYLAVLYSYKQLGTTARNTLFRLTGVTDDAR